MESTGGEARASLFGDPTQISNKSTLNAVPPPSPNPRVSQSDTAFPHATAALMRYDIGHLAPHRRDPCNSENFRYRDILPINFTAVEIITFLPNLHGIKHVAQRLINNGMSNPVHLHIARVHRCCDSMTMPMSTVESGTIASMYRSAMNQGRRASGSWTRKNHVIPETWDSTIMAMNTKPRQYDPSAFPVPFSHLLKGVKKIPEGPDAADLTRAIEYACANVTRDPKTGVAVEYMFPIDLAMILSIVGRTEITPEHHDGAIVQRWEEHRQQEKKALKQKQEMRSFPPQRPAFSATALINNAATLHQSANRRGAQPASAQQISGSMVTMNPVPHLHYPMGLYAMSPVPPPLLPLYTPQGLGFQPMTPEEYRDIIGNCDPRLLMRN